MTKFLFVLSKDDNTGATRCFQFAKIAHDKGHGVNLFFIDDGVRWANKNRDLSLKTPTGDCPADYLPYLGFAGALAVWLFSYGLGEEVGWRGFHENHLANCWLFE